MESEYEGFPNKAWSGKTGINCTNIMPFLRYC